MKLRLRITAPSSPAITFEHGGPTVCLGRDPACQLVLDNNAYQQVSWRHARVELTPQGAFLSDLESTNGTFVNGKPANGRTTVRRGDEIGLGKTGPRIKVLELELKPAPAAAAPRADAVAKAPDPPAPPPPAANVPQPAIRAAPRRHPRQQESLLIAGAAVIGLLVLLLLGGLVLRGSGKGDTTSTDPLTTVPEPTEQETHPTPRERSEPTKRDSSPIPTPPPGSEDLGAQAMAVLSRNCHRCHGQDGSKEGGVNFILDRNKLVERKKLIPGDEKSRLLKRVVEGTMPPEDEEQRPTVADVAVLRRWIAAGAPVPGGASQPIVRARKFIEDRSVLTAIRDHQRKVAVDERRFKRYYTLTHLHNNPAVPDVDLPLYRAAFAKVINSLSWKEALVRAEPVDGTEHTVYCVDLRHINWDEKDLWKAVVADYPYGMTLNRSPDEEVRQLAQEVYRDAGTNLPMVRIDWLVATASRPPLYHKLLDLPDNAVKLEQDVGVNVASNFARNQLLRAGFNQSGVSSHNRLVERHQGKYGAYWKSYDFKSSAGRGHLVKFPLGPKTLAGSEFAEQAFVHDGGEIIFALPNGLQGYLLVDGSDKRIDAGPEEVVFDKNQTSGTQQIVNGLSCMFCHAQGMIIDGVEDLIREGHGAGAAAEEKVQKLYPKQKEMNDKLVEDQQRFLRAMKQATDGLGVDVLGKEPVGAVAGPYRKHELDAATAAAELGLKDAKELQQQIERSKKLRDLGLGPLVRKDGAVKREVWEKPLPGHRFRVFQEAAEELGRGEPLPPPETPKPAAEPKKDRLGHPGDLPS